MQSGDKAPDTAKHSLDLMMAAFVKGHSGTALAEQHELCWESGDVFGSEVKATLEGCDGIARDGHIGFYNVSLRHF